MPLHPHARVRRDALPEVDVVAPAGIVAAGTPDDAQCGACDAVCCRLTVVVQPEDRIADHLTTEPRGLRVMARDPEGWCVAMDAARMCCSIYEARPDVCRRFRMGGSYCQAVREDYARGYPTIPSTLLEDSP